MDYQTGLFEKYLVTGDWNQSIRTHVLLQLVVSTKLQNIMTNSVDPETLQAVSSGSTLLSKACVFVCSAGLRSLNQAEFYESCSSSIVFKSAPEICAATSETYLLTCAPNEDLNQYARPRSLIRVFVVRTRNFCILSDCANAQADLNLRWAHLSRGTFSDIAVRMYNFIHCTVKLLTHAIIAFCYLLRI